MQSDNNQHNRFSPPNARKPRGNRPKHGSAPRAGGRAWYPARLPGQTAAQVRATRPRGATPGKVRPGDRFGRWTIPGIRQHTVPYHGFRCGCAWGGETPRTDPAVCYPVTVYEFVCRCDCGTVRTVNGGSLLYGYSLSCGCGTLPLARKDMRDDTDWSHSPACLCRDCDRGSVAV